MRKMLCCVLLFALAGCSSLKTGSLESLDTLSEAYASDARILAEKTAEELQQRYAPASTVVTLHRVPGVFGETLENDLRSAGFTMNNSGIGIRYKVDAMNTGNAPAQGYVQVSCTDGQLFNFSRPLGQPVRITEPPSDKALPEEHPLEIRPLPDSPKPLPEHVATVRSAPVRATNKARTIAKRNGVDVADFCKWNNVKPETVLRKGREVYLSEPSKQQERSSESTVLPPKKAAAPVTPPVLTATKTDPLPPPVLTEAPSSLQQPWVITRGQMLRIQMEAWATAAGYSLVWNASNDYEMKSSATFNGSFIDAVKGLFTALQANGLALRVTIYQGNNVIEISEH